MIKSITVFALTMLPSVALAYGSGGHGGGRCGGGGHAFLAIALMALIAVLGLWVLRHAEKDPFYVKWAGRVVGWLLVVTGILGFLCGVVGHSMKHGKGCDMKKGESSAKLLKRCKDKGSAYGGMYH